MPTFILGAGFNADAASEAGVTRCEYPLVGETIRLCFAPDCAQDEKSVEERFSEALEADDYTPLIALANSLREADYYIASCLASGGKPNCYSVFFGSFSRSNFLTFNYDSLPETILFRLGHWYPHDGYGVPVAARLPPGHGGFAVRSSGTIVLHLHGSLCVKTQEFEKRREPGQTMQWVTRRDEPLYKFDPHSISANFAPYHRDPGYDEVKARVIAPVLDKSRGLKQRFISDTYAKAVSLVKNSDIVAAIGYSFSPHDRCSHLPLLQALGESQHRTLVVVSPDAGEIVSAMRPEFPNISFKPQACTFKQWEAASFPGLRSRDGLLSPDT